MQLGIAGQGARRSYSSRAPPQRQYSASRVVVLTHQAHSVLAILALSFYSLVLAQQMALRVGARMGAALAIVYVLSGMAGVVWGPRSLPQSADDDGEATRRDVKWLPWVMGLHGSLVNLGVFLGIWATQGSGSWAYYLVGGLGALAALITVTLGFVSLYRLTVLASHPIPDEAFSASGLRP